MSAIAGIIHLDGAPVERADLERMSRALAPFGRERADIALRGGAGLVARIRHITPEDRLERQPHPLPDDSQLLFDGRIDNRDAVAGKLGLSPGELAALADGALAGRAWARWECEALHELVGVFGLAVWQPAKRRLTLARSAPHGKPLQFHQQGERIYFASAPNGLFALPQVPRALDEEVMADLLLKNSGGGDSLFSGIEVVPGAHWITFEPGKREQQRYWAPDPGHRLRFAREEEAWEAFSELFEEVVANQLRATGPIGIQMSGGLDSAAVAGQAARLLARSGQTLHGYTRVPIPGVPIPPDDRHNYSNEQPKVEAIAAMHPNLRPRFIHAGENSVLEGMAEQYAFYNVRAVSPTFATGYQALHRQASNDGIQVLLTGASGNLTFSHNGFAWLRELMRRGRWLTLARELIGLQRFHGAAHALIRQELLDASIPAGLRAAFQRLRNRGDTAWAHYASPSDTLLTDTGAVGRMHERNNIKLYWQGLDDWQRRAALFSRTGRGGADMLQARYGIDMRDPAGDRRVVEFCLALPQHFYLSGGINRRFARLGLAHLIPESVRMDVALGRDDVDWAFRVRREAANIDAALARLASDPEASRYLDLERMSRQWQHFDGIDWEHASLDEIVRCKQGLLGSIGIGNFIRWFEGDN
jgi:asparagine synthase (glutamine-hydrolysing)